ncbi:MAG: hypothetical protein KAV00_07345 [Phycisphaerae bacterium]|nr:hypothetical protein [Phycisphaerae bacterium]
MKPNGIGQFSFDTLYGNVNDNQPGLFRWHEQAEVRAVKLFDAKVTKGKTVLLYQDLRGAYALPFRFDGKPRRTGEGLKIAGSLRGSRAIVTPDGEVLLLTGGYTSSWLLRAKLKDLLDIQIGDTGGNAP